MSDLKTAEQIISFQKARCTLIWQQDQKSKERACLQVQGRMSELKGVEKVIKNPLKLV
ncbi:hypothetical protein [Spirosoma panaciterrae]|uniref:hypothetical protein n=1 Tax=Spirosoma panaciterrae TaxID=496058 RepID=UPI001B7F9DAD|nr:hypothetical protein [Spirosoma panaciterrae]